MTVYTIRHRTQGWTAACGFYNIGRAEAWLADFDPRMWDDKTLAATDFEIIPSR